MQSYESIFWLCALVGTLFFLVRVVFGAVGMDFHHHDGGVGAHTDFSHDAQGTFDAFKIFSLYSLAAFVMMFGWVGLAAVSELKTSGPVATVLGFVFGLGTMVMTAYFFHTARRLETTGTVFTIEAMKGKVATVYQHIGVGTHGVIHVSQDGVLREIEAISEDGVAIDSFSEVKIIGARDNKVAIVKKI